jgi:hexosaminidase
MNNPRKVEYMIFPRLSALSEVLWSPKEKKNWTDFEKRLQVQFKRYDLWTANYSRAYYDLKSTIIPTDNFDGVLWKLETKNPAAEIKTVTHFAGRPYELKFNEGIKYTAPIPVKSTQLVAAISMLNGKPISNPISQNILFNKATGKKITLTTQPSKTYKGDSTFTLVNGVQNEKGLAKSREFLGFSGTDCEAIIDFGITTEIKEIIGHAFNQPESWIYMPSDIQIQISEDGKNYKEVLIGKSDLMESYKTGNGFIKISSQNIKTRFLKVLIKNHGIIEEGNPGAGNKAWLFIDEIEVN